MYSALLWTNNMTSSQAFLHSWIRETQTWKGHQGHLILHCSPASCSSNMSPWRSNPRKTTAFLISIEQRGFWVNRLPQEGGFSVDVPLGISDPDFFCPLHVPPMHAIQHPMPFTSACLLCPHARHGGKHSAGTISFWLPKSLLRWMLFSSPFYWWGKWVPKQSQNQPASHPGRCHSTVMLLSFD